METPTRNSATTDLPWLVVTLVTCLVLMIGSMFLAAAYLTPWLLGVPNNAPRQGLAKIVEPLVLFGGIVFGAACAIGLLSLLWRNFLPQETYDRWAQQFQAQASLMPWPVRKVGECLLRLTRRRSSHAL
jgi:hypothetical protein